MATTWNMPAGSGDRWPEDYERGRPGWPGEAAAVPGLPPSATVLDLGAGTGKLTRLLIAVFDRVVAVEPAEPMRRLLPTHCRTAEVRDGTGRHIPLPEASVDAVFIGEAFHWFDDDRALGEIARVLRSGGALVLMWNLPAGPCEPPTAAAELRLRQRLPEGDLGYDPLDLDGPPRGRPVERLFCRRRIPSAPTDAGPNPQMLDREGLVAFFASMGWIADLADEERLPLLAEVKTLLGANEFRRSWDTHVYWTRLP